MSLSSSMVWEVRTTGNDNNGGGFKSGASGTDYSQQDAAQFSGTDLTVDAVTNTKVTSTSHNFVAADVGNLIQITAGTGWTTGFYEIVSVTANAATLDRSPAAAGTTGGSWSEGGALATIGKAAANATIAGNVIWVKSGTYTISTTIDLSAFGSSLPNAQYSILAGYNASRGDNPTGNGRPLISTSSALNPMMSFGDGQRIVQNFRFDGTNTALVGITLSRRGNVLANAYVTACANYGIGSGSGLAYRCEVTALKTGAIGGISVDQVVDCYVHNTPGDGFLNCIFCARCVADTCAGLGFNYTGSIIDGVITFHECVAYGNSSDGIGFNTTYWSPNIFNCILANNGGYGINNVRGPGIASLPLNYNAFYANTSGERNGCIAGPNDVTLTTGPFTNAAGGDFSLNNTAGGGAACRAAGFPGAFPGATTTGYLDIGAAQHQDAGGAAGMLYHTGGG